MRTRLAVLPLVLLSLCAGFMTACSGEEDDGSLRLMTPNSTVYLDAWDEDADSGDEALVEQKPSGMWVLPEDAPFSYERSDRFTVKVTLDPEAGGFVIQDMGGTKVGFDHDNCLADNEVYATMGVDKGKLQFEPQDDDVDNSNDDCERNPDEE